MTPTPRGRNASFTRLNLKYKSSLKVCLICNYTLISDIYAIFILNLIANFVGKELASEIGGTAPYTAVS